MRERTDTQRLEFLSGVKVEWLPPERTMVGLLTCWTSDGGYQLGQYEGDTINEAIDAVMASVDTDTASWSRVIDAAMDAEERDGE